MATKKVSDFKASPEGYALTTPDGIRIPFATAEDAQAYMDANYPNANLEPLSRTNPNQIHFASEDIENYAPASNKTGVDLYQGQAGNEKIASALHNQGAFDWLVGDARTNLWTQPMANGKGYWTDTEAYKDWKSAATSGALVALSPYILWTGMSAGTVPNFFARRFWQNFGPKAAQFLVRELPRGTAGWFGGNLVDNLSKSYTGKTWDQNATNFLSEITGYDVPEIVGEVTNPGYIGGYGLMDRGIKRAAFNHITPISYTDNAKSIVFPFSKKKEFIEMASDVLPQMFNPNHIKVPAWRRRLENIPGYNPYGNDFNSIINNNTFLNNREEAFRLALGQNPSRGLYTENSNRSYSYNLDEIYNQQGPAALSSNRGGLIKKKKTLPNGQVVEEYQYLPTRNATMNGKPAFGDNLAHNGGGIKYSENNGISNIRDVWDIQPFKDDWRLPNIPGSKWMHKHLPEFEVISALGGNPFLLDMTLPTYK